MVQYLPAIGSKTACRTTEKPALSSLLRLRHRNSPSDDESVDFFAASARSAKRQTGLHSQAFALVQSPFHLVPLALRCRLLAVPQKKYSAAQGLPRDSGNSGKQESVSKMYYSNELIRLSKRGPQNIFILLCDLFARQRTGTTWIIPPPWNQFSRMCIK